MNKDDLEEKLKAITKHFGIDTELIKFTEEVGELLGICYKSYYSRVGNDKPFSSEVEGEIADVLVILLQIMIYFDVDIDKVIEIVESKTNRTIKRIEEGWYDAHR